MNKVEVKVIRCKTDDIGAPISSYKDRGLKYMQSGFNDPDETKYYHLYLVAEQPIKDNDWFMSAFYSYPLQNTKEWRDKQISREIDSSVNELNYHKIIASTNSSLNLPEIPEDYIISYCKEDKKNRFAFVQLDKVDGHIVINIDNEVNIIEQKQNYTRDEILELLNKYRLYLADDDRNFTLYRMRKWFKENLD